MEEQDWSSAGVLAGLSGLLDHLAGVGREVDCFWLLVAAVIVVAAAEKSAVQDRCSFHLCSSY